MKFCTNDSTWLAARPSRAGHNANMAPQIVDLHVATSALTAQKKHEHEQHVHGHESAVVREEEGRIKQRDPASNNHPFDDVKQADDDALGPVQQHDLANLPSADQHTDEGD